MHAWDESGFRPVGSMVPSPPREEDQAEGLVLHSIRTESNLMEPKKNIFMNPKCGQLGKLMVNPPPQPHRTATSRNFLQEVAGICRVHFFKPTNITRKFRDHPLFEIRTSDFLRHYSLALRH
jgi:hypothetical protein